MMPALPSVTVTDAQHAMILAAFQEAFGATTNAEAAAAYRNWLTEQVRSFVISRRRLVIDAEAAADRRTKLDALDADLPPRPEVPLVPPGELPVVPPPP